MTDWAGWLGSFFLLLGLYFQGRKDKLGWGLAAAGESLWVYRGATTGMADVVVVSSVFVLIAVYNYWLWSRKTNVGNKNRISV